MTRSCSTLNSHTAERRERIRKLVFALQMADMMRGDIAELLGMGPSGVRKYVKDLGDKIEVVRYVDATPRTLGEPIYRLTIDDDQVEAYLAELAGHVPARPAALPRSPEIIAARDPRRHFHILADDAHYAVRVSRVAPARDWAVAALFGTGPAVIGARA